MKIASLLFVFLFSVRAFMAPVPRHKNLGVLFAKTLSPEIVEETFYRAVECAESTKFDMDELDRLATELEKFEGCNFEDDEAPALCDKEIQDRLDVAQILRLKIELQLR